MNETPLQNHTRRLVLLSPVAVIAAGQVVSRLVDARLGAWGWALAIGGYWLVLGILVLRVGGRHAVARWAKPSNGSALWPVLAVVCAAGPTLPMLPGSWHLLLQVRVWAPTIVFICINPLVEEGYWRGLLMDAAAGWSPLAAIAYTSVLFTLNHLWFAHLVVAARNPVVPAFQFVLSAVMALVYVKTRSLRWPVAAHFLANLLTPTVAMMLNLYVP
jgi:membrane protease YdiL (CAAX protease family)